MIGHATLWLTVSFFTMQVIILIRFMLYNIRYGTGTAWHFHLPFPFSGYLRSTHKKFKTLSDYIKTINPDIIGLLEVDCGSPRSKKTCQPELLATQLGHYYVYENKYAEKSLLQKLPLTNMQGNAFLTNRKIHRSNFHYFRKGVKRLMIELDLGDYVVLLVHLSLRYRHRQEQLQEIYTHIQTIKKPLILAGDFNALWGIGELKLFLASTGLINANQTGMHSHPSRNPIREIDFILHSPEITGHAFEIPNVTFSDHLPLIFDFELK